MRLTTRPRARAVAIVAAAVALTTLAACGNSGSTSSSSSGSAQSSGGGDASAAYAKAQVSKYEAGVPVSDVKTIAKMPDLKGKTVWYVPIGNSVPVLAQFGTNMKGALDHLGASTHVCDGNFLPTTIASCLNQAATQGAGAVVTAFVDYALIPTAYDNLVSHHIPVLVAGEAASGGKTSNSSLAFFSTEAQIQAIGALGVDGAIADSNGKANILYVNLADSSSTQKATEFAKQEVTAHCPGCTIETVDMQTSKLSQLPSAISAKLVANPKIGYILNSDDTFVTSIISGINSAGAGQRVKVISAAGDLAGLQRIAAGQFQIYDVGTNVEVAGWSFADALLREMAGEEVAPADTSGMRLFYKNNVQGLKLTPDAYGTSDWYGGNSWQQKYLTAWGVQ